MNNKSEKEKNPTIQKGCFIVGFFVFSIIWIVGATITAQLMMWIMEQTIFEASFLFPDLRWLIIIAYVSIVGLPLLMIRFIINDRIFKVIFKYWISITFLGIFLVPGRFASITSAQLVNILQIFGLLVYLIIIHFISKRHNHTILGGWKSEFILIPVLFGAILSIPWILWGALGSIVDLMLNLFVGILAGYLLTIFINLLFKDLFPENEKIEPAGKFFFGLIIFISLLIFSTILGQNGQQWMLAMTLPFSGWIVAGLFKNIGGQQGNTKSIWLLLTITISLPLIWFDPDELSLIIGSNTGEVLSWVSQTISYTVVILVFLIAITGFFRQKLENNQFKMPLMGFSIFTWMTVLFLYIFFGQTGFHGETLFVVMKEQVDLGETNSIVDPYEKRQYVYQTLTEFSIESQVDIVELFDRFHIKYQQYYLVNAIEVNAGPLWRFIIKQRDDVDRILENPILRPLPDEMASVEGDLAVSSEVGWNLKLLGVDRVWNDFGIKGEGIIIGQADSGVDVNHPALRDQYLGSKENNEYTWFDPWFQSEFPKDISGHGTHTLGTILGNNVGVAPESQWIGCVNLGRNLGNPSYYLACMQFLFAPFPDDGGPLTDGKPELGAHILNNSWSCPEIEGCDADVFKPAVSALRSAGIFVVSSNGNNGYYGCESVTDPLAIYQDVFSVGAIDQAGELAQFSSLGPVVVDGSDRIKPDLVAPGVDIYSTMPNASYSKLSGTSMAGPHVVGTVALMWSANPKLIGQIDITEEILIKTATPYEGTYPSCINSAIIPNNAVGYGVVNAYQAVEEAIKIR